MEYPKAVLKKEAANEVLEIRKKDIVPFIEKELDLLQLRDSYDFEKLGVFMPRSDSYDYKLVKDTHNSLVLLRLRKGALD